MQSGQSSHHGYSEIIQTQISHDLVRGKHSQEIYGHLVVTKKGKEYKF